MALITFFNPATKYKLVNEIWLVALLVFPVVLWMLPADFFDHTGIEICPSKLFFNIECFGCGMTRAVMHMHHFQLSDAMYFNFGVVVAYPALVVIWILWVRKAWYRQKTLFGKNGLAKNN